MRIKNEIEETMFILRSKLDDRLFYYYYSNVEEAVLEYAQSGKWGGNIVPGIEEVLKK